MTAAAEFSTKGGMHSVQETRIGAAYKDCGSKRYARLLREAVVFYFSKRDRYFFEAARQESRKADFKVRVGAVLTFQSRIIATGYSSEKTSPVQKKYNVYRKFEDTSQTQHKLHAEVMALLKIRHADIDFSKVSIYIWREYADGTPALARPCEACMAMLRQYGIRHIYYSGDGSRVYEHVA